jgi:hypothetical protein
LAAVAAASTECRRPSTPNSRCWPASKSRASVPTLATLTATRQKRPCGVCLASSGPTRRRPQRTDRTTNSNWPSLAGWRIPGVAAALARPAWRPCPAGRPRSPSALASTPSAASSTTPPSSRRPQLRRRRRDPGGAAVPDGTGSPQAGGAAAAGGGECLQQALEDRGGGAAFRVLAEQRQQRRAERPGTARVAGRVVQDRGQRRRWAAALERRGALDRTKRPAPGDQVAQGRRLHQLHHQEQPPGRLHHVVEGDHARVVEPRRRPGLPQRPLAHGRPFLVGQAAGQLDLLDRHRPVEQHVLGPPHHAHAAAAEGRPRA